MTRALSQGILSSLLVLACAPSAPPREPEPVAEPGPAEDAPTYDPSLDPSATKSTPEGAAVTPPPEPPPAIWAKELGRVPLTGKKGTLAVGTSACSEGSVALIARFERTGQEPLQADVRYVGCDVRAKGKGYEWSITEEAGVRHVHLEVASAALGAAVTAIVFDVEGDDGIDPDALLTLTDSALEERSLGRASDTAYDLEVTPKGEVLRIGIGLRGEGYNVAQLGLDAQGELTETYRETFLAVASEHPSFDAALAARDALEQRCARVAGRTTTRGTETETYQMGVAAPSRAAIATAVSELKSCGVKTIIATVPAP